MATLGAYALLLTAGLNTTTSLMLLPVLPFFATSLGASPFELSLLTAVYYLAGAVGTPVLGGLSDCVGRKPIMLLGLAAAGALHLALSAARTVTELLLVRAAMGFVCAMKPTESAYLVDGINEKMARARLLGQFTSVCTFGQLIGPLLGGYISAFGFAFLCRVMAFACATTMLLGALLWHEPMRTRKCKALLTAEVRESTALPWRAILTDSRIGLLVLAQACKSFGWAMSEGPEVFFLHDHFQFGEKDLANLFMAFAFASTVGGAIAPRVLECIGDKACCEHASIGCAFVMATMVLVTASWEPYLFFAGLGGILNTVWSVAAAALLAEECPSSHRGSVFGFIGAVKNASFFFGPLLGAALYGVENYAPYIVAAVFFILAAAIYQWLMRVAPCDELSPEPTHRWLAFAGCKLLSA